MPVRSLSHQCLFDMASDTLKTFERNDFIEQRAQKGSFFTELVCKGVLRDVLRGTPEIVISGGKPCFLLLKNIHIYLYVYIYITY